MDNRPEILHLVGSMARSRTILVVATAAISGCMIPLKTPVIQRYGAAACVLPSPHPKVRMWDAQLTLRDGSEVVVSGASMAGGLVSIRYKATGQSLVAANAGDYIYPEDVRFDGLRDLLYVKASGLAGGTWQQTWLFEYDLHAHRLLVRQRVPEKALAADCSLTHRNP